MRIEQGCNRLAEAFHDLDLVRKSKTLIDAFDLIKFSAEDVAESMKKVEAMREKLLKKACYQNLWRFLRGARRKKRNAIVL